MMLEEAVTILQRHVNYGLIEQLKEAIPICLKALDEYAALKRNLEERRRSQNED